MTSAPLPPGITVVAHPIVAHELALLRSAATSTGPFRAAMRRVGRLLAYEALATLPTVEDRVETPVASATVRRPAPPGVCAVSVLRAGEGLLQGVLDLVPDAAVGHLGFYRDETTKEPVPYLERLPPDVAERTVLMIDPMLATGGSAVAAAARLKAAGARSIRFTAVVAAPEGARRFADAHPDVPVWLAAIDSRLDENAFIVPGLGDAGDRLFGTGDPADA